MRTKYLPTHVRLVAFLAVIFALSAVVMLPHFSYADEPKASYKLGELEIIAPWMRAIPHGTDRGAGFLTIINHGSTEDRLVSVKAAAVKKSEIHSMTMANGVMVMRPVKEGLVIPAHGKVELQPGGYHIMLIGVEKQLSKGDSLDAHFTFSKAGSVDVQFDVKAMTQKAGHS